MGKKKGNVVFYRVLCTIVLLFTAIAPVNTLASVQPDNEFSITIHSGSESRTLIFAEAYMGTPNNGWLKLSEVEKVRENGRIQLRTTENVEGLPATSTVMLNILYDDNGESHQLLEEVVLTKGDNQFTIPNANSLLKSKVSSIEESNSPVNLFVHYYGQQKYNPYRIYLDRNARIVSSINIALPFSLEGLIGGRNHILNGVFSIGEDIQLTDLLKDASLLDIQGNAESMSLQMRGTKTRNHVNLTESNEVIITNGVYDLSINNKGQSWQTSSYEVKGVQVLEFLNVPDFLKIEQTDHFVNNGENQIAYKLKIKSGIFYMNNLGSASTYNLTFKLYDEDTLVEEWVNIPHGQNLELEKISTGTYTLEATLEMNGKILQTTKSIAIYSSQNTLKGTIITAEDTNGAPLTSGNVTLYEVRNYSGYKSLVYVQEQNIQLENGVHEAFIPDAYLLDGKEYVVTIVNEQSHVVYAKKFTGQATKDIHFMSADLKPLGVEKGTMETLQTTVSFGNSSGFTKPIMLSEDEWKASTDLDIQLSWRGKDEQGLGYSWLKVFKHEGLIDLTKETWATFKPSSTYKEASIGFWNGDFKGIRLGGEEIEMGPQLYLVVEEPDFTYAGYINIYFQKAENLKLSQYTGTAVLDKDNTQFSTSFRNQFYNEISVSSNTTAENVELTYDIFDSSNNQVGDSIVSNDLKLVKLPKKLPNGDYSLKLSSVNFDQDIAALSLEIPFTIEDVVSAPDQAILKELYVEKPTAYGSFEHYSGRLVISEKEKANEYSRTYYYYQNPSEDRFNTYESYAVDPTVEYEVQIELSSYEGSTLVIDRMVITGKELLENNKENKLKVSSDLPSLTINNALGEDSLQEALIRLQIAGSVNSSLQANFHGNSNITVYLPNDKFYGLFAATDHERNTKVLTIPELDMSQNRVITIADTSFTKYSFTNGQKKLGVFGYQTGEGQSLHYNPGQSYTSVSYPQKMNKIELYVADRDELSTLWGYRLSIPAGDYGAEKQVAFSNELQGEVQQVVLNNGEDGSTLQARYSLSAGESEVRSIYRAVEQNRMNFFAASEPVRDYVGLFNSWNLIASTLSLTDQSGKVVWESEEEIGSSRMHYLPAPLSAGEYTFKVHIPTASQKSITLTKKIQVDSEDPPFIQLGSPNNGMITHEDNIKVSGITNPGATVTLEVMKEQQQIDKVTVTAADNGSFTHVFSKLTAGKYKLVVSNQAKDASGAFLVQPVEASFTIESKPTTPTNPGGGGGNSGGGTSVPPTKPSVPVVVPEKVDEQAVAEAIQDVSKKEVVVKLTPKANETVSHASFDKTLVKAIVASKKPLVIVTSDTQVTFSAKTLQEIVAQVGESVVFSINAESAKANALPVLSNQQTFMSPLFDFTVSVVKGKEQQGISVFKEPVSISTTVENVKDPQKVAAFYLNEETKRWQHVGGKLVGQTFTFQVPHFSKYVVMENAKTFQDIQNDPGIWAKAYIEVLASKGIINGKSEEVFGPKDYVTRSQFALLLSRALHLPTAKFQGVFPDVSEAVIGWSAIEIEAAHRAGIVNGNDGMFKPNDKITRQQMVAMIIRAIEYQNPKALENISTKTAFKDEKLIADYAKLYVDQATALGVISGREEKDGVYFAPRDNATRSHAAKMIYMMMELE